ncbi:hypothetical protein BDF19DRAFT_424687 [Syncephalis fuscata]|nr:hypothetical protein BDF19DRAFT_424687 [Syncephalis fuscata]
MFCRVVARLFYILLAITLTNTFQLHQLQPVSALVTFQINNKTTSFHTQDPFQVRFPAYLDEGVLIQGEFDDSTDCVLTFDPDSPVIAGHSKAIVSISEKKSYKEGGCATMSEAANAAINLGKKLSSKGGPSVIAVLYLLRDKGKVPGAPREVKYTTRMLSFKNELPSVHIAFVLEDDFRTVVPKSKKQVKSIPVLLQQEPGPWNEVFMSGEFIAYTYILMGITTIFVIRSMFILIGIMRSKKYPAKNRIAIYVSAFIGAILFIVTLPMNSFTEEYQLIYRIMELVLLLSFHLLLLLWHHFITRMRTNHRLAWFKYVIWFSLASAFFKFIIRTFFPGEGKESTTGYIVDVNRITGWIMLTILSLFFIYYGVLFWIKRQECTLNMVTRSALTQQSNHLLTRVFTFYLGHTDLCICFFGLALSVAEEILKNQKVWRLGVAPEVVRMILKDIAPSLRIIAILFVLDARAKSTNGTSVRSGAIRTPYGIKPSELSQRSNTTAFPDSSITVTSSRSRNISFQPLSSLRHDKDSILGTTSNH